MEQVTVEEAQARLTELIARVTRGETVIIEAPDDEQIQLVRVTPGRTYVGSDGRLYYRSRSELREQRTGIVYYPNVPEPPDQPIRPGSAVGLIQIGDDFDEPLEEFEEYTE